MFLIDQILILSQQNNILCSFYPQRKRGTGTSSHISHGSHEGSDISLSNNSGDKGHSGRKYIPPNARNGGSHGGAGDEISAGQGDNEDLSGQEKKVSLNESSISAADNQSCLSKGKTFHALKIYILTPVWT